MFLMKFQIMHSNIKGITRTKRAFLNIMSTEVIREINMLYRREKNQDQS